MHVIEQNLQLAGGACGVPPPGPKPAPLRWDRFIDRGPASAFSGSVVLLPGAGKANKLWPLERFRALARHIGPRAVAVWGPGEREMAEAIGSRVAPPTTLQELAGILQTAGVVIGADTGPLHLAAALGTPVIGLYGPTDPRRNGPFGQLDRCVDRYPTTKLMDSISVEDVVTLYEKVTAS
jgi:ADP-heptose:LPS heptosyltransferase